VPLGPICEEAKTILWITIAISDAVLADKHFKYVFRPQPMGSQWGRASVMFLKENLDKLKAKEAKEVKLAVVYEDGPYGVSVSAANLDQAKKDGFTIVLNEGYNNKAQDLSALILKLKASNQDAILHTGYYPDIVLFMKQARELGLKTKGIFGHGAGYANFVNLEKQLGKELAAYLYNADPAPAQVLDPAKLDPSMDPLIKDFLKRYKDKYKEDNPPTHATQGFAHAWMLLKTMDQAVAKYGAPTPDNIRQAALELKIAEGKSPAGYGMDFNPSEDKFGGQNKAAYPVLVQWVNQKVEIVWPKALVTQPAKLPLPADAPLAAK
jgi:branched-chain amino acid transport system substrate-binding protein